MATIEKEDYLDGKETKSGDIKDTVILKGTKVIRQGNTYYLERTMNRRGKREVVRKKTSPTNPHPAVKLGLVNSEEELIVPCIACENGEMYLKMQMTMARYPRTEIKETGRIEGLFKWERGQTSPPSFVLMYYECGSCGAVYPYAKSRESLVSTLKSIKGYYERNAIKGYTVPSDERLYLIAKQLLELV